MPRKSSYEHRVPRRPRPSRVQAPVQDGQAVERDHDTAQNLSAATSGSVALINQMTVELDHSIEFLMTIRGTLHRIREEIAREADRLGALSEEIS